MNDILFFIYCIGLSLTGFIIASYAFMTEQKIEIETKIGLDKGYSFDDEEGNEYFAKRFERWKAGSLFVSQLAPTIGIVIALIGAAINLIINSWWSSLLVLLLGYLLYPILTNLIAWKIQIAAFIVGIFSIIMIIIKLVQ